jgi:hypothetical protein
MNSIASAALIAVPTAASMIVLAQTATSAADVLPESPLPPGPTGPPHVTPHPFPLPSPRPLPPEIRTVVHRTVKVERVEVPVVRRVGQPAKACGEASPQIDYSHGMQVLPRLVTVNVC